MKTVAFRRIVIFFGMCFVLGLSLVQAQGQNLLTNPGFEKPFATLDGNPPRQVAQGWSPWNLGGGQTESENVQPEYYPASDQSNGLGVPRIRSGSDAQQYQTFFSTHDGGLFQRVTGVTVGTQLQFSAYVYVWSTTFDDANKSESPGGIVVMVGIDPTGGTSGDSANIIWSQANVQYDAYNQYSVTATASQSAVTVFVRTTVSTPVKNNDIYVDDASLTAGSSSVPTATATLTKTTVPPSPTNTLAPTATKVVPTATSTSGDLGIVGTDTPIPTQTPLPSAPPPPAPTNTRAPTVTPTFTLIPTTVVPPTQEPTQEIQIPTNTAIVVTATLVPTATPTLIAGEFSGKVIHSVQPNDTVGQLATLYGSSTDAIIEANGLNNSALIRVGQTLVIPVKLAAPATSTPTITPLVPPPTPAPTTTAYTVQAGDTLNRIAARFNTTATTLAQLNGITNPNIIHVGQQLIIPVGGQVVLPATPVPVGNAPTAVPSGQPKTYVVRLGDTLFRIALRSGVTLRNLIQANGIRDPNLVFVGQVLVIP